MNWGTGASPSCAARGAIPDSEVRWESIQRVAAEIGLMLDPGAGDPDRVGEAGR